MTLHNSTKPCNLKNKRKLRNLALFAALILLMFVAIGVNMITIPGYKPKWEAMVAWCIISDFIVNLKGPECHGCPLR